VPLLWTSHTRLGQSTYEVIPENTGICQFIWEHLNDINWCPSACQESRRNLFRLENGCLCPEVVAVGHRCIYEGCYLEDRKVQKILDWPDCNTLTEVCRFLEYAASYESGSRISPSVQAPGDLDQEGSGFHLGPEQKASMEDLKQAIITAPCLQPIDYCSNRCIILAVDSSCIATGFILLQLGADNKCYPSQFGSITWNKRESRYSQAKIEIYGLCMLSKHIGSTLSVSKILEWKSTRVI